MGGLHGPGKGACPDTELIAALADRRLAGDEAARVEEHVATCASCYAVYSGTMQFNLADSGDRRFWRHPLFQAAAGLAAAAGLVFALFQYSRLPKAPVATPIVAELAQAVGATRLVEPRLTGGFRYGRLIVMRSGEGLQGLDKQPAAVIGAVSRIREKAESDTSPETLGALGITYLVSGDVGAAVKALESASAQAPENARLLSDLAAAYLVRASRLDEPADIPMALEMAERAIALKDAPDEAWFNRALALESLHLVDAAKKAWEDYLQRDSSSGWADEARQHLESLKQIRQSTAEEDKARVRAALEEGASATDRLADEAPHLLREYLDDELLPAWAEATLVGHPDADVHREQARVIGEALARTTTDPIARDAARALVSPAAASSSDPIRSQAQGYRALSGAKRLYERQEPSCPQAQTALRGLEAGGTPYASWARFQTVLSCHYPSQPKEALAEFARLQTLAEPSGYVQLLGRVRWMQGLIHGRQGELTASLEQYRAALDAFRTTRDAGNEAKVHTLLAENFRFLGDSRAAWRERQQSMARLGHVREVRRYPMVGEVAMVCLRENMPRSALHFQTAAVETAFTSGLATAMGDALLDRARIQHRLGNDDQAARDLLEARPVIAGIPDAAFAEWEKAEANRVEGEILARQEPEVAIRSLGEALRFFEANAPVLVPELYLNRARAQETRGADEAAEADLLTAIQVRERQRAQLGDAAFRVPFFDQASLLFAEMTRLQATKRHDQERALAFVERGRARQLADSLLGATVSPLQPTVLRRALPEGLALIYYAPLEDRLLAWVLTRDELHFIERPLPSAELSRLVAGHQAALERRAPLPVVHREAGRLHEELVRPFIPFLAAQRALIFIPDGVLQSLAFASLWDARTNRYLVEDYAVGRTPSGTIFVQASTAAARLALGPAPRALVIGNPQIDHRLWTGLANLPGAEAEAVEIAGLYLRSELLTGKEATKGAFLKSIPASQVVHYSGHAAVNTEAASAARLLFARDPRVGDTGALYLRELDKRTFPRTRVLVLAACRTAAGEVSRVEGPLNLGRPFLAAGVPSVITSLWDIEDSVSRRLLVAFHRALLLGNDPVQALREAQISFIRDSDPSFSHPANWAAFICMGGLDPHSLSKGVMS